MTTRELMTAASVLMLLAGAPAVALADEHMHDQAVEAPAEDAAAPADETATDEATDDAAEGGEEAEEGAEEAPAE